MAKSIWVRVGLCASALTMVACGNGEKGGTLESTTSVATTQQRDSTRDSSFKLASIVAQTKDAVLGAAKGKAMRALSKPAVHVDDSGDIHVVIHAKAATGAAEAADLTQLGAQIVAALPAPTRKNQPNAGVIEAWVPASALSQVTDLPWVVAVTPPTYPTPDQVVTPIVSEGVAQMAANTAQAQGITGTGVTIGVVSDGVTNIAASQARNELPGNCPGNPCVNVLGAGGGDEGTAMLEIVRDMAPGANLLFQGTGNSVATHVAALNALVTNGANIIAEDIPFDSEPAFQYGLAASTGDNIAANGVSVFSSAGNLANQHTARVLAVSTGGGPDGKAFAATPPGCANTPANVVAIGQGGDTTFDGQFGNGGVTVTLQWSEPRAIFPTAGQGGFTDLNVYIMDSGLTRCLAQSVGLQANGVGDTLEVASVAGTAGTGFKVVVDVQGTSSAVAAPLLDLRIRGYNTGAAHDPTTVAGSLNPDSNYTGSANAVAAINSGSGAVEGFSAGGPVQFGLTTVCPGNTAGPCTGVAGPAVANQATTMPTMAASDGVSVSGVGNFGAGTCPAPLNGGQGQCQFFGTSAAAPSAAGCAALVRQRQAGGATVATINTALTSTATDIAPPGVDPVTGAGLLNCFSALNPPQARCHDVTVDANGSCQGSVTVAQVDNGSTVAPGLTKTVTLSSTGPFPLGGPTPVTLTVSDGQLTATCTANITVQDSTPPVVTAPNKVVNRCLPAPADETFTVSVTDNCSAATTIPVTGLLTAVHGGHALPTPVAIDGHNPHLVLPLGVSTIQWKATDGAGNPSTTVTQTITVNEDDSAASCCTAGQTQIIGNDFPNLYVLPLPFQYCVLSKGSIDSITGGLGADFMSGGSGFDTITSGASGSVLVGRDGNDTLLSPLGTSSIYAGDGDDIMNNNFGGTIYAGAGNDLVIGVFGSQTIYPGPGRDAITGGPQSDTVVIYDLCEVQPLEALDGGPGNDTLITPVPLADLLANGVIVANFENIVVDPSKRYLSECF